MLKDYTIQLRCPRCRQELDMIKYRLDSYNESVHWLVCPSVDCFYEDDNFSSMGAFFIIADRYIPFDAKAA